MTTRKDRGHETETTAAAWFAANGFPFALPVGSGRAGRDLTGMPGLSVEIKARRDLNLPTWLRQAAAAAGKDLPMLIHRPDGFGPATIALWPVTFSLRDATTLLRDAGYGDPRATTSIDHDND